LFGWWLPPPTPATSVVLIVHGRSANISTRAAIAARLSADGFGVLLFDFRGYGRSTGQSSEGTLIEDTIAAYDWLRRQGVEPSQIIVLGQSLGDAAAAQLGARRPIRALALVSPFTSLPDALADHMPLLPVRFLPWTRNRFDVEPSIRTLRSPVLLVASRDDGLVPYTNSKRLAAAARNSRWLEIDGERHDGLLAAASASGRLSQALSSLASAVQK
jgi:pimeloyl-ACP methyl ester carboxylesterase